MQPTMEDDAATMSRQAKLPSREAARDELLSGPGCLQLLEGPLPLTQETLHFLDEQPLAVMVSSEQHEMSSRPSAVEANAEVSRIWHLHPHNPLHTCMAVDHKLRWLG